MKGLHMSAETPSFSSFCSEGSSPCAGCTQAQDSFIFAGGNGEEKRTRYMSRKPYVAWSESCPRPIPAFSFTSNKVCSSFEPVSIFQLAWNSEWREL